jgi:ADP-dependent NAD(P)H-hydrate dehydratase
MPEQSHRKGTPNAGPGSVPLTPELLGAWCLPEPAEDADKDSRGRVLVVAGSPELPGTAILAATAALRAGAGKLRIATVGSIAPHVGIAVPEARVFALPETGAGGIDPSAAEQLADLANGCQATLIGPGLVETEGIQTLLVRLLPLVHDTMLVLDSEAMMAAAGCHRELRALPNGAILTPHAGEMAGLLKMEKSTVAADPDGTARRAAAHFGAVLALKGRETIIADPDGHTWRNQSGNVGLATSGSGDTLSGIIAGLVARGAEPAQAAAWGVYLHGSAGDRLAEDVGPLGFLARELLAEIPRLMTELSRPARRPTRRADSQLRRQVRPTTSGSDWMAR